MTVRGLPGLRSAKDAVVVAGEADDLAPAEAGRPAQQAVRGLAAAAPVARVGKRFSKTTTS